MRYLLLLFIFICNVALADIKIGIIGDSNSSLGVPYHTDDELYYKVAETNLRNQGYNVTMINTKKSSVSNSTTDSGLKRIIELLEEEPHIKIMVIALGFNDGGNARDQKRVYTNLEKMVVYCLERNILPILGTVDISWWPYFNNKPYKDSFIDIYSKLASKYIISTFPFIFKELFYDLNNHDRFFVHPNGNGHRVLGESLEKVLIPLLEFLPVFKTLQKTS